MSVFNAFKALSVGATVCIGGLAAAAGTIHLRGDENPPVTTASVAQRPEPASADLKRCRGISHDQQDKLRDCRKILAEKLRQFLGENSGPAGNHSRTDSENPPSSPRDQSRLPPDLLPTPMQGAR